MTMIRYIALFILLSITGPVLHAQTVIYSQDFQDTSFHFKGYVLSNLDKGTPSAAGWEALKDSAWVIRQVPGLDTKAAVATSAYDPAIQANDWMITSLVRLGKASRLSWDAVSLSQGHPDAYQVYISTSNQSVNGCLFNFPVMEVSSENASLTTHSVDLAEKGYAGQDIFIGFRLNTAAGGGFLAIDNIRVTDDSLSDPVALTFNVRMNAYDTLFSADTGFVDIAGNFNNWDGTNYHLIKSETDSNFFSLTVPGFHVGDRLEFKFRINGSWHHDTIEFPYGQPNREWVIEEGVTTYNAWYNGSGIPYGIELHTGQLSGVGIYPNPVSDFCILSGVSRFDRIEVSDLSGRILVSLTGNRLETSRVDLSGLTRGIYLLRFYSGVKCFGARKIVRQ